MMATTTKKTGSFLDSFKGLAQKKGTKDKEIEKYEKMLEEHPDDRNALNALGDLYAKRSDAPKACEYYLRVGELYAKDGFTLKAIAVYKKAQRARPDQIRTYIDLADLYVQKGLIGEAKSNYLTAAEMQAAAGAKHESLDIYRKIADLDPSNVNIRSKLAAMYEKENFVEDAAIIYAEIGDVMIEHDHAEGSQYYHRAIELQPANEDILARIGYAYVDRNLRKEAVAIFQRLRELSPRNLDYQEQIEELQAAPAPPPKVAAKAPDIAPIAFSEDELSALNLGEEPAQELSYITGLESEPATSVNEHLLDFPLTDVSTDDDFSDGAGGLQDAHAPDLDFHLSAPDDLALVQDAPPPIIISEDRPFDLPLGGTPVDMAVAEPEGGFFDLASRLETAAQLGRELDSSAPAPKKSSAPNVKLRAPETLATSEIGDIIKEFKQGVLEEVGAEDFETHYELGISYKEMSLLDDAIEELKLAALEASKFVECQGMIGLCYLEKGEYANAVKAFLAARAKVNKQSEEYQDLTYQIAVSYEESNKIMEAVHELQALYQLKPEYRDVKQRLKRLMG